jgi:hypothetical protein
MRQTTAYILLISLVFTLFSCANAAKQRSFSSAQKIKLFGSFQFRSCHTDHERNDCRNPYMPKLANREIELKPTGNRSLYGEWKEFYIHENHRFWARIEAEKHLANEHPHYTFKVSMKGPADKHFVPSLKTTVANLKNLNAVTLKARPVKGQNVVLYPAFVIGPEVDVE